MSQRPKFKFTCFKKGHRPMDGVAEKPVVMNDSLYLGRVCRECLVVYFEYVGPASQLVSSSGNPLVSD
jgi:hypothetical protein